MRRGWGGDGDGGGCFLRAVEMSVCVRLWGEGITILIDQNLVLNPEMQLKITNICFVYIGLLHISETQSEKQNKWSQICNGTK